MEHKAETKIVEIKNLTIGFDEPGGFQKAVDNLSFDIYDGEILGVVGESGSGKSMSALALMGLLKKDARVPSGQLLFEGADLLSLKKEELRKVQGSEIAMIFQEPMTSLNPVMTIGRQVGESLKLHTDLPDSEIHVRVKDALLSVGLPGAEELCGKYPHELSGGMRQRVMIAMAMINSPRLLIADEPTTALDVIVQSQILKLLKNIHREKKTTILFISHDLRVIQELCDRVLVMRHGVVVEQGLTKDVLENPIHEYTKKLVASIPEAAGDDTAGEEILRLSHLDVYYDVRSGAIWKGKARKHVIQDVSLDICDGEIFGIVGESGCGKSTLCKAILGLNANYTGEIYLKPGVHPQMVFQDPYSSLNPARKIGWILEEPLKIRGIKDPEKRKQMVSDMLLDVGLEPALANRRVRELSGGQRQRISIGSALLMDSGFMIADEPVSALDVSVQSQILNLLLKIHREKKMTMLFITHDLNIVRRICKRVAVIYLGEIVETGNVEEVYCTPLHPYTSLLLKSITDGNPDTDELSAAGNIGESSMRNVPGCPFYSRCPKRREKCLHIRPASRLIEGTHSVKCFLYGNED